MKVTTHGDHLLQLERLRWSNAYLVREEDGFTLVDTSLKGSRDGILAAAREAGGEVRRIVITHAHDDHYGALEALRDALPGVEILMSARDAQLMRGDTTRVPGEPAGRLPKLAYSGVDVAPTKLLDEGERVGSLEVVFAPGHTPGQIALRDMRDGTLICGDAYLAFSGLFVTSQVKLRFPFPGLICWNKAEANTTAEKLRALDPSRLATGHGPVLDAPGAAMDKALSNAPRK